METIEFKTNTHASGEEVVSAVIEKYGKLEAKQTLRLFFGGKEINNETV